MRAAEGLAVNESLDDLSQSDEKILTCDVPDEALEAAAQASWINRSTVLSTIYAPSQFCC